jgi:hypothetical protein
MVLFIASSFLNELGPDGLAFLSKKAIRRRGPFAVAGGELFDGSSPLLSIASPRKNLPAGHFKVD